MMPDHYMLDADRQVYRATDMGEFFRWFAVPENRVVGYEETDDWAVSTVFLGLDQNKSGRGAPQYFETRVFDGPLDGQSRFHATWAEAEAGHREMVGQMAGQAD
jgi:hypothetical protein